MKWLFYIIIALVACSNQEATSNTSELPRPDINPVLKVEEAPKSNLDQQEDNNLPANSEPNQGPGSKITFEHVRFNFGEIYHAEKVEHKFEFTNTGDQELQIKGVKVSCGCTTPSYPSLPIAPGEKGFIGVVYNSVGKQGTQKATIRVATNDPDNPEVRLYLSGRVLVKPLEDKGK